MVAAFITSAYAEATSLTLPTHQAGDLLIMVSLRNGSASPVTVPSEWLSLGNSAGLNNDNLTIGCKTAASSGEASGTWTDASMLLCCVYRDTNLLTATYRTGSRSIAGGSTGIVYLQRSVRTGNTTPSTSYERMLQSTGVVVGIAASPSTATTIGVAPSGMTNRVTASGASANQITVHDTGSAVSNWPQTTATVASAIAWQSGVIEIVNIGVPYGTGKPTHALLQRVIA
jgi:hypothetical protein